MTTPEYVAAGDPIPPEYLTAAGVNRLLRTIHDLRGVLAPLLERPYEESHQGNRSCLFCGHDPDEPEPHGRRCPVLRRDELLGRASNPGGDSVS